MQPLASFGIFDNHRPAADADLHHELQFDTNPVVVVFDPHVLTSLYNANQAVLDSYHKVFHTLSKEGHLFAPQESFRYFWDERPNAIERAHSDFDRVKEQLDAVEHTLRGARNQWNQLHRTRTSGAQPVGADSAAALSNDTASIEADLATLRDILDIDRGYLPAENPYNLDPTTARTMIVRDKVVELLKEPFAQRVGPEATLSAVSGLMDQAQRCYEADHNEAGEPTTPFGDLIRLQRTDTKTGAPNRDTLTEALMWQQVLDYVDSTGAEDIQLIIVANESDTVWWRSTLPNLDDGDNFGKRPLVGARPQLVNDYLAHQPGGMLHVWRPEKLFTQLNASYNLNISDAVIEQANQTAKVSTIVEARIEMEGQTSRLLYDTKKNILQAPPGALMRAEEDDNLTKKAKALRSSLQTIIAVPMEDNDKLLEFVMAYHFADDLEIAADSLTGRRDSLSEIMVPSHDQTLVEFLTSLAEEEED